MPPARMAEPAPSYERLRVHSRITILPLVSNAQPIGWDPDWFARSLCLFSLKGNEMKTSRLKKTSTGKSLKWFQRRPRAHDPMLVFNMSIFNGRHGWERAFNPIASRENVWA